MCFSCARMWTPFSDSVCLHLFVSVCANQFSSSIRVTCETSLCPYEHLASQTYPNLSRKARAPRRLKLPKALRIISLHCSNMFKQKFITHHLQDPLSLCSISQTAVGCESTGPPCSTLWMVPLSWHCSTILQSDCSSSLSTCFEKKRSSCRVALQFSHFHPFSLSCWVWKIHENKGAGHTKRTTTRP